MKVRLNVRRPELWRFGVVALLVAAALAALIGGLRARRVRAQQAASVLVAGPADAWLILTVDLAAASPLLRPLLGGERGLAKATRAASLGSISDACGFEPVEHLRELMLAAPEGGDRGDFGLAFSADLTMEQLATCARKAITSRGGTPSTTMHRDFAIIGDASAPREARLAYRERGPFLVGRGVWLDAMIDAAAGVGPLPRSGHDALRAVLAPAGGAAPAVVVTALVPRSLRDQIRAETRGSAGAFSGVLGVEEAGASVTTSADTTALEAVLRCETPAACIDVRELVERGRLALSSDPGAQRMGLGPLLDGLSIDAAVPGVLALKTRAPTGDLAQALARLLPARAPAP